MLDPLSGLQKGAKSPAILLQRRYEPPPVAVDSVAPDVCEGISSDWKVVVAVRLAGAGLSVVAMPLMVVSTGVIVATGEPLASTETHKSRASAVTKGH